MTREESTTQDDYGCLTKHQLLVLHTCELAEGCVPVFNKLCADDARPALAISAARRWLVGSATQDQCQSAYYDAKAAAVTAGLVVELFRHEERFQAAFKAARCAAWAIAATLNPDDAESYFFRAASDSADALELGADFYFGGQP